MAAYCLIRPTRAWNLLRRPDKRERHPAMHCGFFCRMAASRLIRPTRAWNLLRRPDKRERHPALHYGFSAGWRRTALSGLQGPGTCCVGRISVSAIRHCTVASSAGWRRTALSGLQGPGTCCVGRISVSAIRHCTAASSAGWRRTAFSGLQALVAYGPAITLTRRSPLRFPAGGQCVLDRWRPRWAARSISGSLPSPAPAPLRTTRCRRD